jgi:hypothetical protein
MSSLLDLIEQVENRLRTLQQQENQRKDGSGIRISSVAEPNHFDAEPASATAN